ncbi:hypothetical protein E8E14_001932 [Neopestalotiopsis sp. 37M]|nr:hypothetical protein E8E14_001932 [Neopestalotiopsis sp. 37M]
MSIRVALVGGGIWAREEHLSAQSLAESASMPQDLYAEDSEKGFSQLLERSDITAYVVSLPIKNQASFVKRILMAGKHVLSEKPVSENVKEAKEMIDWYRSSIRGSTWCVAENWRYLQSYEYARDQIKSLGKITGFSGQQQALVGENWKFNLTEWRRNPTHQGGYLLDGGVHYLAGLRKLLSAHAGNEIAKVSAYTNQTQPYLPPVDTANVILRTQSGISGTFALSVGTTRTANAWTVACENGWILVEDDSITMCRDGSKTHIRVPNERTGVPPEIRAWGESLAAGNVNKEQDPEEALADLELLELILRSGEQDGAPQSCKFQSTP